MKPDVGGRNIMDVNTIFIIIGLLIIWVINEMLDIRLSRKDMREYLRSPTWKQKREEAFVVHGRFCAVCRATTNLEVHHLRYRKWLLPIFGRENVKKDLRILCKKHHPKGRYSAWEIWLRRLFYRMFGV